MRWSKPLGAIGLALALVFVCVTAGSADPPFPSVSPSGIVNPAAADGPSDHITFSQDDRDMRLVAYDSAADNLVPGDTNGHRDVFVLRRVVGVASFTGVLLRASVGAGGQEANGDSVAPSLDGTTGEVPHCVAFESNATNLSPADPSPDSDVYVRDLSRGRTILASPGVTDAHNVSIDGHCRYVAFQAGVRVLIRDLLHRRTLRVARGSDPDIETDGRGIAYVRAGQVYFRHLTRTRRHLVATRGRELLVSDTATGGPGNGLSSDPVVDDHGHHIAFVSAATDLCTDRCQFPSLTKWVKPSDRAWDPSAVPSGDANGPITDIYRRTIGVLPHSPNAMVNASYDSGYGQANAASSHPGISRTGKLIVFQSAATNRIGGWYSQEAPDALPNIYGWYYSNRLNGRPLQDARLHVLEAWEAQPRPLGAVPGSAVNPSITSRGNYIGFTSDGGGLLGEANGPGIPDVFALYAAQTP
jgi:Tol biopolymer transport system component